MRDLEIKGIVRTAVEGTNLSLHTAHADILEAECVRTFPTVRFPANELLKREETETLKQSGVSIITALHHGHGVKHRMFAEAPIDLMYGFRGNKYDVDLLSPYEMLPWWELVRIVPPTRFADCPRSEWTPAGRTYTKMCQEEKDARNTKLVSITLQRRILTASYYQTLWHCAHYDTAGVGRNVNAHTYLHGLSQKFLVHYFRPKRMQGCFAYTCVHGHSSLNNRLD